MSVRRHHHLRGAILLFATGALTLLGPPIAAQEPVRTLDLGAPITDTLRGAIPDAILTRVLDRFNAPTTTRLEGNFDLAPGGIMTGTLALYGNIARIGGTVRGSVVVLNGDLRVAATGRVEGDIIVLGGRLTVARGAVITGDTTVYLRGAAVQRQADGRVIRRRPGRALTDLTSAAASFPIGPVVATLRAGAQPYNRVEGLPISVGPSFTWQADPLNTIQLDLAGIVRTASSNSQDRPDFGWTGRLSARRAGSTPLVVGLEAGSIIAPMADQHYSALESGLTAFLLRRDYRDWYATRGWGLFANWTPTRPLTVGLGVHQSRERSVHAGDAFSLFRGNESWRANTLVDDGRFQTIELRLAYDTRDEASRPTSGWWIRGELRRITSRELTPASLPTDIRDALPTSGYQADEADFDARYYLRLNARHSVHLRVAGGGWLGGDPMLVQHRRSMGGLDPLSGYDFRYLNCDRRLRRDPGLPALCDRQLLLQAEFRRALDLNLSTRIGGYTIGLQRVEAVAFGDVGTAWLAGDGKGRVPSNRIQNIGEWRSDVGVGLDGGTVGIYLAKAIADPEPIRLLLRLQRRF
ncbi:MAG: BamA/TamA family outer membrane protein [Gemmatimonadota bacterium]